MATNTWRVNNATALGGEVCAVWQPNHAYSLGARCICRAAYGTTTARSFVYECTTAGTSHAATEPTWPTTAGNTVADGANLIWTCRSPSDGSWDNATASLCYLIGNTSVANGDTVLIHNAHSETDPVSRGLTFVGGDTVANTKKFICVNKATDAASTGAIIIENGSFNAWNFTGFGYSYGITWKVINGFCETHFYNGRWILEGDGTTDALWFVKLYIELDNFGMLELRKCNLKPNASGSTFYMNGAGMLRWRGGAVSAEMTTLFATGVGTRNAIIEDVDLSNVTNLVDCSGAQDTLDNIQINRCKLKSGVVAVVNLPTVPRGQMTFFNSGSTNISYGFKTQGAEGYVIPETTVVRTGGASDGTTPISMKMVSTAYVMDNYFGLKSIPIHAWTASTTEKTFTVEGVYDSATNLQNDEIWMEFEYPANGTDGLGAIVKDKCVVLAAPADKTASTVDWTTTGITNVNKFKFTATVTPGKAGPITAKIILAKASTTVYIDPMITES